VFRGARAPDNAPQTPLGAGVSARPARNRGFFLEIGIEELENGGHGAGIIPDEGEDEPYLAIASDRLEGKLPERVTENELMRRYGLTRPQTVKIMARVAHEGWAERLPGHGWGFLSILTSREAYDHGYRFRAVIESAALLEPGFQVDRVGLAELRAEQRALLEGDLRRLPRARLFAANAGFHERIIEWSSNPFFMDALRRINRVRRLIEYRLTVDRTRLDRQCREHLELLDILEGGDLMTAAAYLRVHIGTARQIKMAGLA
jgi:DNA-binding GntR family transcriptional regulator